MTSLWLEASNIQPSKMLLLLLLVCVCVLESANSVAYQLPLFRKESGFADLLF